MTIDTPVDTKSVPTWPRNFPEQYQLVYRLPQIQANLRTAQKSTTLRVCVA
jgi:hypothetical protein